MPPAQPLVLGGSVMGSSAATRIDEHGAEDVGVSAPSVGLAAGTARQALEGTFGRLSDGLFERLHALALSEHALPQGSYVSGGPPNLQTAAQALEHAGQLPWEASERPHAARPFSDASLPNALSPPPGHFTTLPGSAQWAHPAAPTL